MGNYSKKEQCLYHELLELGFSKTSIAKMCGVERRYLSIHSSPELFNNSIRKYILNYNCVVDSPPYQIVDALICLGVSKKHLSINVLGIQKETLYYKLINGNWLYSEWEQLNSFIKQIIHIVLIKE